MTQSYSTDFSPSISVLDEKDSEHLRQFIELLENSTFTLLPSATFCARRLWRRGTSRIYSPRPRSTSSANRLRRVATFRAYRPGRVATSRACRPRPTTSNFAYSPQPAPTSAYSPQPAATSCADSSQPAATSCADSSQSAAIPHAYKYKYWVASLIALLSILLSILWVSSYFSPNDKSLSWKDFPAPSTIASADPLSTELGRHESTQDAPNNLPHFPGQFVGRDNDIQNITSLLFHPHTRMVHIFGLPAVGKSTIAIHLGHKVVSHGVAVRYINMDDSHISKSSDIFEPVHSVDNDRTTSKNLFPKHSGTLHYPGIHQSLFQQQHKL